MRSLSSGRPEAGPVGTAPERRSPDCFAELVIGRAFARTAKADNQHFRDYSPTGHDADMPKSTKMANAEVGPEEWYARSCPIPAIHPVPDIRHSSGGSDASRVDKAVRGDVVDLAARSTDIH
jgi:hypothetical protein